MDRYVALVTALPLLIIAASSTNVSNRTEDERPLPSPPDPGPVRRDDMGIWIHRATEDERLPMPTPHWAGKHKGTRRERREARCFR